MEVQRDNKEHNKEKGGGNIGTNGTSGTNGGDTSNNRGNTEKRKKLIRIGLVILLAILLILILFQCSHNSSPVNPTNDIEQGVIDLPSKDEAQKVVNEIVEQGMFQVFMNTSITVNKENEANLLIQNSENNHYSTYVEVYRGEELLYKSDIIAPGYKLEKSTLEKDLDIGIYDCKAYFHIVDSQTNSEINKVGLSITIEKKG